MITTHGPVIYFAGKIGNRDWRHSLVQGLGLLGVANRDHRRFGAR
jgi:hypothetical protein